MAQEKVHAASTLMCHGRDVAPDEFCMHAGASTVRGRFKISKNSSPTNMLRGEHVFPTLLRRMMLFDNK